MAFTYLLALVLIGLSGLGVALGGVYLLAGPLFAFGLVPFVELFMSARHVNVAPENEDSRLSQIRFDGVVAVSIIAYFALWALFVYQIVHGAYDGAEVWGASAVMGLMCGGIGINLGHELGHRKSKRAQTFAKMLLASSLYMHFFIEHNRGHHARVATEEDPASARRGEILYAFYFRSIVGGFLSAWQLEFKSQKRRGNWVWGPQNEMVQFMFIQLGLLVGAYWLGGGVLLLACVMAGFLGILLLETVNYLEHYGLRRSRRGRGYEKVLPIHSWNSDHPLGRALLFELSRHSDHHANAKRHFSILRSMPEAPQLPTGYPGMILLALVPPVFFAVMHPLLDDMVA